MNAGPNHRVKVPLQVRILFWLILNLVLLASGGLAFVAWHYRFGLDLLVKGRSGERIQALTQMIAEDVGRVAAVERDEILARYSEAYRLEFLLVRTDGTRVAGGGAVGALPAVVLGKVREIHPGRPGVPSPPFGVEPRREVRPPVARPPRFAVRTVEPTRYWVGIPLGPVRRGPSESDRWVLLIVSPTLHGGGLFFDVTPVVLGGLAALMFSVAFWFPLVRGISRALVLSTRATEQIAEGRFDVRLSVRRGDELGQLGAAVNRMAERLQEHVLGQKRFLGDIAHELCAPMARMQLALGILESRAGGRELESVRDLRDELEQMSGLVNELLSFSKESLGSAKAPLEIVDLAAVVEEVGRREAVGGATVETRIPAGIRVVVPGALLRRAVGNVLRNAVRYAGREGPIVGTAVVSGGWTTLSIADGGGGVPEASLARLFEPFYRVDSARARETGGVGLGLAIVKSCVDSWGGVVSARNLVPRGFEISLTLPSAPRVPEGGGSGGRGRQPA